MMHGFNLLGLRCFASTLGPWQLEASAERIGTAGVTVATPGIECAEALIGRKTVLLEAASVGVDFSNALIQRAFADLADTN